MKREQLFEWLETCPSHEWEVEHDDVGCVSISFRNIEEQEECRE